MKIPSVGGCPKLRDDPKWEVVYVERLLMVKGGQRWDVPKI